MTHQVYCLECNAVIGEEPELGEGAPTEGFVVCQTCAQHPAPGGGPEPASSEEPADSGG